MITAAVFDTKPYDPEPLQSASANGDIEWRFLEFRLTRQWAAQQGVEYVDAPSLAGLNDVLSLHVPLTPETKHIIRRETLDLMKAGAILINVTRGALIDTTALIEALAKGTSFVEGSALF